MSRYIDADCIEPHEIYEDYGFVMVAYMDDINNIPTADVVPVIRCKDCRWFRTDGDSNWCAITGMDAEDENGFCHEAEKKVTE